MDLGSLYDLVRSINFDTHGVEATVTRPYPDDTPITTRVIWALPTTDPFPVSGEFGRQEARRVMALRRDEVPTVPKHTIVLAPERAGGTIQRWRVEGPDRIEADHARMVVVPDPEPY